MGYKVPKDKLDKVYEDFIVLADKKKDVNDDDIALLLGDIRKEERRIKLDFLQVVTGKDLMPMATIRLDIAGELFTETKSGNGPVDAALKAIKAILQRKVKLNEFLIQAMTRGSNDVGKVHMQVVYEGNTYYGFSANTDIITASVEAYLDAVNKMNSNHKSS